MTALLVLLKLEWHAAADICLFLFLVFSFCLFVVFVVFCCCCFFVVFFLGGGFGLLLLFFFLFFVFFWGGGGGVMLRVGEGCCSAVCC